ncbi:MAG: hypothetical protein DRI44_02620 [Chlamydiae bacterium]|nr:MAG: hypothetical protein DRI44_02620 [Chlamydiota bacterium]
MRCPHCNEYLFCQECGELVDFSEKEEEKCKSCNRVTVLPEGLVENLLSKNAIIVAQDHFWANDKKGNRYLICPKGVVVTDPKLLTKKEKKMRNARVTLEKQEV